MFIMPADDKYIAELFNQDPTAPPGSQIPCSSPPVLMSDPVEWEVEFRTFVMDCAIATPSPYLRCGELTQVQSGDWYTTEDEYSSAEQFINRLFQEERTKIPPAVVIDVGRLKGMVGLLLKQINADVRNQWLRT